MGTNYRRAAGGLIALSVGVGCGGQAAPPAPERESPEKVEQTIQQSLARVQALHVVDVTQLVLDLPAEARDCYGGPPCPGFETQYQAERARQAPRVERLASLAEAAARNPYLVPRDPSEADAALQALAGLAVVQVSGLVQVQPKNNGECYNLPCPADIEAAKRENGAHVAAVFATVDAAKKIGL
jgi:hypothetical protein